MDQKVQKYRAWNGKEMIYQSEVNQFVFDNEGWHVQRWSWIEDARQYGWVNLANMEDSILMESTGRKDKSGAEIYQGDWVGITDLDDKYEEKDDEEGIWEVEWGNCSWRLEGWPLYRYAESNFKVLGNIYENVGKSGITDLTSAS